MHLRPAFFPIARGDVWDIENDIGPAHSAAETDGEGALSGGAFGRKRKRRVRMGGENRRPEFIGLRLSSRFRSGNSGRKRTVGDGSIGEALKRSETVR